MDLVVGVQDENHACYYLDVETAIFDCVGSSFELLGAYSAQCTFQVTFACVLFYVINQSHVEDHVYKYYHSRKQVVLLGVVFREENFAGQILAYTYVKGLIRHS